MGFVEALALIFVVLKLIGLIQWSWLAVLSPIWITLFLVFIFCMLQAIFKEID